MDIIHSLIIQAKEKKKEASEEKRRTIAWVFSLSFHMCEGRRLGFCCYKIELGEIVESRSKEGLLSHPQALEGRETQAKVRGSLRSAHTCGGNNYCRDQKLEAKIL